MRIKTRPQLLRVLREQCAYDGPEELAAVQKFLKDNPEVTWTGDELSDVWKTVTLSITADAGETVKVMDGGAPAEDEPVEEEEPVKAAPKPQVKSSPVGAIHAAMHNGGLRKGSSVWNRKQYQQRINRYGVGHGPTQAKFSDPEVAEFAAAWFRKTHANGRDYAHKLADAEIVTKAGSTQNNLTGGVLVPDEFLPELIMLVENYGAARRCARVIPMSRDVINFPRITSNAAASHVAENGSITAADDGFDNVSLTAKKAVRLVRVSNELLEDAAISVADTYSESFAYSFAIREDQDYILGDGTSTYGGHVGLANSGNVTLRDFNAAWSAQTLAGVQAALGLLEYINTANMAFLCSRQYFFAVLLRVATAAGGALPSDILAGPGWATGMGADAQFMGYPVYFSYACSTTDGDGELNLYMGDFKSATFFGDRRELSIAVSDQRYFDNDQTAFRATERFAINIAGDGRGSTTGPLLRCSR